MQLPDSVRDIRARYVARFPIPQGAPGEAIEEAVRQWAIGLAEQVAFERPGEGWGTKRADPGRPISKDGLARQMNGRLWIFDMVTGAGTGAGRLVENPEAEDITGQVFVEVTPKNHLSAAVPPPVSGPSVPAVSVDVSAVLAQLAEMNGRLARLEQGQQASVENEAALGQQLATLSDQQAARMAQVEVVAQQLLQAIQQKRKGSVRVYGRTIGDIEI